MLSPTLLRHAGPAVGTVCVQPALGSAQSVYVTPESSPEKLKNPVPSVMNRNVAVGPLRTMFQPAIPTSLAASNTPSYGARSKKSVPVIVTLPVVGGGGVGTGHFLVRLSLPLDEGLPGSF